MKINLASGLFLNIPQPDSYHLWKEDEYIYLYEYSNEIQEEYWNCFDSKKWLKNIFNAWRKTVDELLTQLDKNVKVSEFKNTWSPSEYNFYTDYCEVDVEIKDSVINFLKGKAYENKEKFKEYIKEKYSSHSGFTSYMPNNIEALEMLKYQNFDKYFTIFFDYYIFLTYPDDYTLQMFHEHLETSPCEFLNDTKESNKLIEKMYEE